MDHPCNAIELHMLIGCINYHCDMWPSHAHTLKLLTDQSGLKKKAPLKWTDEMKKAFLIAYSCRCSCSLSRPQKAVWRIYWCLWLPVRCMHYPRRKASCLLLANADKVSAKLDHNGKGNAFHRCNSQKFRGVLLGADIMFLRIIRTWHSILSKQNMFYAGVQKLKSFTTLRVPATF